jgi:hypothetical protein
MDSHPAEEKRKYHITIIDSDLHQMTTLYSDLDHEEDMAVRKIYVLDPSWLDDMPRFKAINHYKKSSGIKLVKPSDLQKQADPLDTDLIIVYGSGQYFDEFSYPIDAFELVKSIAYKSAIIAGDDPDLETRALQFGIPILIPHKGLHIQILNIIKGREQDILGSLDEQIKEEEVLVQIYGL